MKTAYELAMERLSKTAPTVKLTAQEKKEFAELDSKYKAKIAEREISLKDQMERAAGAGEFEKMEQLKKELLHERKKLEAELEEKKQELRKPRS
jgi:hypothetical protein